MKFSDYVSSAVEFAIVYIILLQIPTLIASLLDTVFKTSAD